MAQLTMAQWLKKKAAGQSGFAPTAKGAQGVGFKPFVAPTRAPVGSYDPAYDAQLENAQTGFGYTAQDYDTAKLRTSNDYTTNTGRLKTDFDTSSSRMGEDYGTQKNQLSQDYGTQKGYLAQDRGNSLGDLLTARTRGTEDYTRATGDLGRNYANLGDQQSAAGRAAGAGEGGALAQALLKRQANQGRDQSGLDTQQSRFLQDNTTNTDRTNQSYDRQGAALDTGFERSNSGLDTSFTRGKQDLQSGYDRGSQDLGTNFFRGNTDLDTNFRRAGEQNAAFGRQINAQTLGIAAQNGGLPTRPENEHTYKGITYQTETHNGKTYRRLPNGRLVPATQKLASGL